MNIVGEGFPGPIIEQVKKRQEIHGSGYANGVLRSHEQILYLDANTSWCKLVSSVNLNEPPTFTSGGGKNGGGGTITPPPESNTIVSDPEPFTSLNQGGGGVNDGSNNSLAKQFILFNGVKDLDKDQRVGIDYTKSPYGNNHAYGIGGTDFGLRPMMGIISANITHENRGSIRRATVKIKAWNTNQFRIIDALYLRLGFSVLLEWGHTMWYDNDGTFHNGGDIELSLASDFLEGKGTYQDFLDKIYNQRLFSKGNYDAMFAKITNFHWSFMPDGSYDITLNLISIGDVMESFKMNVFNSYDLKPNADTENTENKSPEEMSAEQLISLYANSSKVALYFNSLIKEGVDISTATFNPLTTQQQIQQAVGPVDAYKVNERGILVGRETGGF